MGHYEDDFYEIYNIIERHGLRKEYDVLMQKMNSQDKYKHMEIKDQMWYACNKVVKLNKSKL